MLVELCDEWFVVECLPIASPVLADIEVERDGSFKFNRALFKLTTFTMQYPHLSHSNNADFPRHRRLAGKQKWPPHKTRYAYNKWQPTERGSPG